jgi:hypothetical protein
MVHDPVTGKPLDIRFEMPVVNGPSWERLCDGLKYQGIRDHVETEFTCINSMGEEKKIKGAACGINPHQPRDPSVHQTIRFIPETDCSTNPIPCEIDYWPRRNQGHFIDVRGREMYT